MKPESPSPTKRERKPSSRARANGSAAKPAGIVAGLMPLAVPIGRLHELEGNPRRGDVPAVARSLAEFEQRKPIVARLDGTVIAGNHTLKAARELGWGEVAVVFVDDDDARAKAYALADNRTAELGGYDDEALLALIAEVQEGDAALMAATGWSDTDVLALKAGLRSPVLLVDADVVPEHAPALSKPGDVWLLGDHRVMCGSSTDPADVGKLMAGRVPQSMVTDPPYGVDYGTAVEFRRQMGKKQRPKSDSHVAGDGIDEVRALWDAAFPLWVPLLAKKGSAVYCWAAAGRQQIELGEALEAAGLAVHGSVIWVKSSFSFSRSDHKYRHEPAWICAPEDAELDVVPPDLEHAAAWYGWRSDGTHDWFGPNNESSVWEYPRPSRSPEHPTQKPVELIRRCVRNVTAFGGLVVDPFLGSGTTVIAAYLESRVCFGMELKGHYVDVICKRWQQATGVVPVLEASGAPHDFLVAS